MSCSYYGLPQAYSQYPNISQPFYQPQQGCQDPYNNITNYSWAAANQLNLNSLMPKSFNDQAVAQAATACPGNKNSWNRYSVTPEGVARYTQSSGSIRIQVQSRNSLDRVTGTRNLLRSDPSPALGGGPVQFNASGFQQALVNPQYQPWIGCGQ